MDCRTIQKQWIPFLEGTLPEAERVAVEQHLEACEACQATEVLPEETASFLRQRLPRETAPDSLRQRLRLSLVDLATENTATEDTATGSRVPASVSGKQRPRAAAWLRSSWTPRLAMAAIVVLVVLGPVSKWFRAPALAVEAVERYEHHLNADWSTMTCCEPLDLQPGEKLGDPAQGARVPDLSADGLHLVGSGRCDDGEVKVTVLVYASRSDQVFSLYITDRALDNFHAIRTRVAGGIREARHEVHHCDVTIWEKAGLVWFWIGPHAQPEYTTALTDLRQS